MFNLESWTSLDAPRDLAKVFDTTEYAKWKSFRQSEDSRYVALTCRAFWAACLTARTPSRWKSSLTKSTWMAPITPSICG